MSKRAPKMTEEELRYFEKLKKERAGAATYFKKSFLKGIWRSITEKYSEQAHFVYELLQNADDAKATKARFVLSESGLIFAHNGKVHFSITNPDSEREEKDRIRGKLGHINSITSIGSSSKSADEIGKFGIGFKSVFQYTDTPHIYDPPYTFKINDYIVPQLLEKDHPLRRKGETLFWLPFNSENKLPENAFSETRNRLQKLENPLLFLRNLREIEWNISTGDEGFYIKESDKKGDTSQIKLLHMVNDWENEQSFKVFEKKIVLTENNKELYIHIAFKLDEKGKIVYIEKHPCYCFFPTKEHTGLRFIIQAPFMLTDSRDLLKEEDPVNNRLIKLLAQFMVEVLPRLKEDGKLDISLLKALPIYEETAEKFKPLYDSVLEELRNGAELLPAEDGSYVGCTSALLARGRELVKLLNSEQLSLLFEKPGTKWISSEVTENSELWDYLKDKLGIEVIRPEDIVERLSESFLKAQTDNWLVDLYKFLRKRRDLWNKLKKRPFIRLSDNSHVTPFNSAGELQAFLPTDNDSPYPTVKRTIVEDKEVRAFLENLGLHPPDEIAEITKFILPKYRASQDIPEAENLEDVRKINKTLKKTDDHSFLEQLADTPFLAADNCATGRTEYKKPTEIYLTQDFTKNKDIEIYFEGNPDAYLLNRRYREFDSSFFRKLGCSDRIKVFCRKPNWSGYVPIVDYHSHHKRGREGFDPGCNIDGLEHALKNINLDKAHIIWNLLLKYWKSIKGEVEFSTRQDYVDSEIENQLSTMGRLVREHRWLPDKDGKFHHRFEIRLEDLHEKLEKNSLEAQMVARNIGLKTDIDEEVVNKLPSNVRRILEVFKPFGHLLDEEEILEEMKSLLADKDKAYRKTVKEEPADSFSYQEEFRKAFSKRQIGSSREHIPPSELPNPERRIAGIKEEINISKTNEPLVIERFKRVPIKKWEQKNFEARTFLKEQYGGRCQICNYSFDKRDGEPYFEGVYLVSRTKARWIDRPGNILCLCANCCAKFTHGTVEAPDILDQIENIRIDHAEEDELSLKIILCGKEETIKFTKRHMLDLHAIIQSENQEREA